MASNNGATHWSQNPNPFDNPSEDEEEVTQGPLINFDDDLVADSVRPRAVSEDPSNSGNNSTSTINQGSIQNQRGVDRETDSEGIFPENRGTTPVPIRNGVPQLEPEPGRRGSELQLHSTHNGGGGSTSAFNRSGEFQGINESDGNIIPANGTHLRGGIQGPHTGTIEKAPLNPGIPQLYQSSPIEPPSPTYVAPFHTPNFENQQFSNIPIVKPAVLQYQQFRQPRPMMPQHSSSQMPLVPYQRTQVPSQFYPQLPIRTERPRGEYPQNRYLSQETNPGIQFRPPGFNLHPHGPPSSTPYGHPPRENGYHVPLRGRPASFYYEPNHSPKKDQQDDRALSSDSDTEATTRRQSTRSSKKRSHNSTSRIQSASPIRKSNSNEDAPPSPPPTSFRRSASLKTSSTKTGKSQKISTIQNSSELSFLGSFKSLSEKSDSYKMISKYVYNSIGVPKGQVKLHSIFEMSKWTPSNPFKTNKILLWCKTTRFSILNMAKGTNGCVAFYDRICRAFAVQPDTLNKPFQQIILLCSVSLGNVLVHKRGFQTWEGRTLPRDKNSVKGTGRWIPDPGNHDKIRWTTVPNGKTIKNTDFPSYDLDYNEFMVYQSNQVNVKFAVDIEVTPSGRGKGRNQINESESE